MPKPRRIIPARNWQGHDDPARTVARAHQTKLARSISAALKHLRLLINVNEIANHMRHANARGVANSIPLEHFGEVLKQPFAILGDAFEAAAHAGAHKLASEMRRHGHGLRYRKPTFRLRKAIDDYAWDRFDEATQRKIRDYQDELIRDLGDQARSTVETVIMDGLRNGDALEDIARSIRDSISLTDRQAQAVANYRRELENLEQGALNRALRDSGYDAAVQDAIDGGNFLSASEIDNIVEAYADNYLDYRAATIAGTESLRASNMGLRDSYVQAAERGVIDKEAVTRHWQIAGDEKVCPVCESIVENNPNGVGLDEDFQSDDGPVDDAPLHTSCRCTVEYVTDLDYQPEET